MIVLLQRVKHAEVAVDGKNISSIKEGILAFVAIEPHDTHSKVKHMAERILNYRIFSDHENKMNLNVIDIGGEILLTPQFTLAADTRKGRRPSFSSAATPELGKKLFDDLVLCCKNMDLVREKRLNITTGQFGADMQVTLCNNGPVTFLLRTND